jgi:lipoprotein-anchoring transpeptidase ErfK/SrfK
MTLKPVLFPVIAAAGLLSVPPAASQPYPYPPSPYAAPPYWSWGAPGPRYVRPFRDDDRYAPPGYSPQPRRYIDSERPPIPATPLAPYERPRTGAEPPSVAKRDGGPRPPVAPVAPQIMPLNSSYAPGTVVIETQGRQLLLIVSKRSALRYPISVGREGFQWTGTEKISRIADWPDWYPPAEMRARDRSLPEMMTGGIRNPLGAKALYLGNSLYRIHGTNDARTVGYASSSGCFRMLNGHVVDLAARVGVGTPVVVIDRLPRGALNGPWSEPWPERSRSRS